LSSISFAIRVNFVTWRGKVQTNSSVFEKKLSKAPKWYTDGPSWARTGSARAKNPRTMTQAIKKDENRRYMDRPFGEFGRSHDIEAPNPHQALCIVKWSGQSCIRRRRTFGEKRFGRRSPDGQNERHHHDGGGNQQQYVPEFHGALPHCREQLNVTLWREVAYNLWQNCGADGVKRRHLGGAQG
jgi:hypothetical protein